LSVLAWTVAAGWGREWLSAKAFPLLISMSQLSEGAT
jgi:hypothetical protein